MGQPLLIAQNPLKTFVQADNSEAGTRLLDDHEGAASHRPRIISSVFGKVLAVWSTSKELLG